MKGLLVWITGLAGSGKTTLAAMVESGLRAKGVRTVHVDGDAVREIFGNELGFHREDRLKNAWRIARLCSFLTSQGFAVVCSTVSLFHEIHGYNRKTNSGYLEVHLAVSAAELTRRNKKGLYGKGGKQVVGRDIEPEFPKKPDMMLANDNKTQLGQNAGAIISKAAKMAAGK
jgi:adenylylsulfate kinase